jgi:hypothetical protein
MFDDIDLPPTFSGFPRNVDELSGHIDLSPETARRIFKECDIESVDPYELAHISSFHAAAPEGDDEQRLRVALAALRDFRGKEIDELVDQDEPTGELQIADLCEKHGLDKELFIRDIGCYGLLHLACPECKQTELWQVQHDRVTGDQLHHPLQVAYFNGVKDTLNIEYIFGDAGEDEDPPEVGIECMKCHALVYRADLVISPLALTPTESDEVLAPRDLPC